MMRKRRRFEVCANPCQGARDDLNTLIACKVCFGITQVFKVSLNTLRDFLRSRDQSNVDEFNMYPSNMFT
jgi:hypothetical protein